MADNVLGLDGKPVKTGEPVVDPYLVGTLELMLEHAREGRITSFGVVTLTSDNGYSTGFHVADGDNPTTLLGAASRLAHRMNVELAKRAGDDT